MRRLVLCLIASCGFSPSAALDDSGGRGDDAGSNGSADASDPLPAPLHLAPPDGTAGSTDVTLDGEVTINTTDLTITGVTGEVFEARPMPTGGGDAAVLRVHAFTIAMGANVHVVGSRPLIVIASDAIEIDGLLDAAGHSTTPGPGGAASAMGAKPGGAGSHAAGAGSTSDSGGGGGGFGKGGAAGGTVNCATAINGGGAGGTNGDDTITMLVGGSGGGRGQSGPNVCVDNLGGAGGGAIQLTSFVSVHLGTKGAINVGGGGGTGGTDCGNANDGNSGAGGGSGGTIVLQAPRVINEGTLVANGGGGGGSGTGTNGGNSDGDPGQDANPVGDVAKGGGGHGNSGNTGGNGGGGSTDAAPGSNANCGDNGGGGGGGVGWIAVSQGFSNTGTVLPTETATLPL